LETRARVAKEAARLLYTGEAEEYMQAKQQATINLGLNAMPSNFEVALELDLLADQIEGEWRRKFLVEMRNAALGVMRTLSCYGPVLIGSVWRGTARKGSDIDIVVYADELEKISSELVSAGYSVIESEDAVAVRGGRTIRSRHITLRLDGGQEVEVVVRPPEERGEEEVCEIYGDPKRGIGLMDLEKLMSSDPLRKFVPRRRFR
jgi:predicted nucleotidyltransferase